MANVLKRKTPCKYGSKCYRKNPKHLQEYSHEGSDSDEVQNEKEPDVEPPKKKVKLDDFFSGKNDAAKNQEHFSKRSESTEAVASSSELLKQTEGEAVQGVEGESLNAEPDASDENSASIGLSSAGRTARPLSPEDPKENIKCKFLVEMPDDFYEFWEFAKTINPQKPSAAFASTLGLHLVGPYDVLAGKTKHGDCKKKPNFLRHWRYYFDPPEMLTIVKGEDKTQFHLGYYRDDPKEMPAFVASNSAAENCVLRPQGENIFAAINFFIEEKLKISSEKSLSELQRKLKSWAERHKFSLEKKTLKMKARDKKAVCKCFHGVGVVVPVDKNGIGYRPVPETQGNLKSMLKKIKDSATEEERNVNFDPLMELVMLIQFANDECDYGEGLELGLDLFCYGGEVFHKTVSNLLPLAYRLLGREEYAKVIEAHLENRRHSAHLSELE